jgi:16S rRNA processing protein RimM
VADAETRHLVVGRLRKPHGLKGECAVFPLTADPERVFAVGRTVWVKDLAGATVAGPLVIDRSRPFHREWLIAFRGYPDRDAVAPLGGKFLAADAAGLTPLQEGEVYQHELVGFAVQDEAEQPLGLVSDFSDLPAGLTLEVQGPRREWLLPYRKEFVVRVDREARKLVVRLPEGMTEL